MLYSSDFFFFFFNDTATTEIYTLSLHDALPICLTLRSGTYRARASLSRTSGAPGRLFVIPASPVCQRPCSLAVVRDRKSTRLNSSHGYISYAVFCLKKKKKKNINPPCVLVSAYS